MRRSQRTRHWLVVRDTDRHGGSDPSDGGMQRRQSCIEFRISPEVACNVFSYHNSDCDIFAIVF